MVTKKFLSAASIVFGLALLTSTTNADHSWGNYHWERSSNPFTLTLGDNVDSNWDSHLDIAGPDWGQSSVIDTAIVTGGTSPKRCKGTSGLVEVCNSRYGYNGWLGLAQIWVSGGHITKGVTKLNDSYFDAGTYNTDPWRQSVICQEIGHTLGLGHNDENFNNDPTGTCMDYSSNPVPNQHPNQHDYDQLVAIYSHSDDASDEGGGGTCKGRSKKCNAGFSGPPAFDELDLDGPGQWGRLIGASASGRTSVYELDFGNGNKIITHVIWALESN